MCRAPERSWGWWGLVLGWGGGGGDFGAVVEGDGGVEALVVGVADGGADVDGLREGVLLGGEVEGAFGVGVDGEPVLAVDGLVVGGEGRGEVFVAGAGVLGNGLAVDEDDLVVLLREPDVALEVAVVFDESRGACSRRRRCRAGRRAGGRGR